MSSWRIAINRLYVRGGVSTSHRLDDGTFDIGPALLCCRHYGLVTRSRNGTRCSTWTITEKGIAYCEGRIAFERPGPKKSFFKATWLLALPRISLGAVYAT